MEETYLQIITELKQNEIEALTNKIERNQYTIQQCYNKIYNYQNDIDILNDNSYDTYKKLDRMLKLHFKRHIHYKRKKEVEIYIKEQFDEYSKYMHCLEDMLDIPHELYNLKEFEQF